jgi:uncharacterized protein YjbI with pentapeptide repeats
VHLNNSGPVGASFKNASLENADFTGADLTSADFTGADLFNAKFTGARLDGTIWPADVAVPKGWRRTYSGYLIQAS